MTGKKKASSTSSSSASSSASSSSSSSSSGSDSSSSSDSDSSSSQASDKKSATAQRSDDEAPKRKSVKPKASATIRAKPSAQRGRKARAAPLAQATDSKKKSIFSPENSSDSEPAKPAAKTAPLVSRAHAAKAPQAKPKPRAAAKPVEKPKEPKKVKESSASSATSTTGSTSSSDSDSSGDSAKRPKKSGSGSDAEVTRKLTRSASTRKSKHVLGKRDSDSDSDSRSPAKPTNPKKPEALLVERSCPLEGCTSAGHLSGKFDKHFILEACPTYHNVTLAQCATELAQRRKREEQRSKALARDHQQNLARIRDLRAKFKQEPMEDVKPALDKTREPDLGNLVPEYDLQMFRDAQALASERLEQELKSLPSTRGTKSIEMGRFEMEVWYQSPYPEDYARLPKLYLCEYCLRYMKSRTILERHVIKCVWRHPPGHEVYRKDRVSVWEVDGKKHKQFCQNLCLLAKFFLDHKTLYYDVEPFLFYVMTLVDAHGCHTVGYFSKEKNSFLNYNVSCILTLPPYQRQGYGRLLIDFSYLLTRVEGKIGSPEKPLSDLGLISYRSYWKDVLLSYLCARAGSTLSVKDISHEMAIHSYDIVSTLQALGMMKYWKGKHIVLKKQDVLDEWVKRRGHLLKEIDPSCLRWVPPHAHVTV